MQQAKANERGTERAEERRKRKEKQRGKRYLKQQLLPGIGLAVVFSGNNVFEQLTSGHPEMQEVLIGYLLIQTKFLLYSARFSFHGDENLMQKLKEYRTVKN